mmetsp:Transcript_12000/g.16603  ORF Transcript_12000/g.16603 Transcript_12000/m.16603 type:complete len:90 (+) Transcript_12000:124-393(+)|eukprot:CAMPEP_0185725926 /NCGR_PEP_ID=MMETSP1171-20130828/2052_1 /TAXON_ID=374046 /ORGANISM="Helicotheca tamensis, Strain CCMP826" /LENGTH=89 /DNA_ID=CAMNT_0028394169 /DNA_START=118 /DNA_END=387 /DNA_ORIENTATION=-
MKLSLSLLFLSMSSVAAFTASPAATTFTRGLTTFQQRQQQRTVVLFSEPSDDDEEEGLDLNLEEMFEMFDAADKEEDFDDAVKKVKGSD